MRFSTFIMLVGLVVAPAAATAEDYRVGDIEIAQPWARASATPQARTGAAYLSLLNRSETPDRLVGASTPVADRAEIHTHEMDGNIMRMRQIDGVEVAPGEAAVLRPGGLHLMLVGLKRPLRAGERVPLTLSFERAGKVEVEMAVASVAAMEPEPPRAPHTH